MKKILAGVFVMIIASVAVQAQEKTLATVEGAADLERVKRARFRETYVNTEVDFTRYSKLLLGDAYFDYRDVGEPQRYRSSMMTTGSRAAFSISNEERERFEQVVDEAFTKELSKSKVFEIVESLDENTIIMRGAVVDIIFSVPPGFDGRSKIYLSSVGDATLVMEFLDGKTGEVLARVAERRAIGSQHVAAVALPTNQANVWHDVRRWARDSARRLRSELESAMED